MDKSTQEPCNDCGKTHPFFECDKPKPMTNEERIKADAETATSDLNKKEMCGPIELMGFRKGYIAGATAWAEKTEAAIERALHKERNALQAKVTQMDIEWLKRAQVLVDALEALTNKLPTGNTLNSYFAKEQVIGARKALEQWKTGKEVEPEHNISIGEHITYCHDCGFPIDECQCDDF